MVNRKPFPKLSLQEKDRRWSLLRQRLQKEDFAALIVYGGSMLGAPVHYLTQQWGMASGFSANGVIFPAEGHPIMLSPGMTTGVSPPGCWIDGENVYNSADLATDLARQLIRMKIHKSRIGVDSFGVLPVQDYQTLTRLCPDIDLVEAHRLFAEIRGPKSPEELVMMEDGIRVSELAHRTLLANLKTGAQELAVVGKVEEVMRANGVGERIILINSQPEAGFSFPGTSIIERPNRITFSPEFSMTWGYGSQAIRTYCWEEPKGEYKRMFELCAAMRQMLISDFRPGVQVTEMGRKIEGLIAEWGFDCRHTHLGHALGVAYGETPYITPGPTQPRYMEWTVQANETYVVHPMILDKSGKVPSAWIGDMFLIGSDRTRWMTTFLPGLPEIIPQ